MGATVFANGMSIACKAASGQTAAAMPDVCLSPPTPPAGPVPIPYPNTAMASDTDGGSTTVMIGGDMVMLKDQSTFKKSTGNEAATKSLPMGVVTHCLTGEASFVAWSMDVKFEGQNVPRHMDLMLHNEQSMPANTPTWPYLDQQAMSSDDPCRRDAARVSFSCTGDEKDDCPPVGPGYGDNACVKAKRCMLSPYDKSKRHCCDGQTPHHIMPKRGFKAFEPAYDQAMAPCVCAEGFSWHRNDRSTFPKPEKTHPDMHDVQDYLEREAIDASPTPAAAMSYSEAKSNGLAAHATVFPDSECNPDCLAKQIDNYHKGQAGVKEDDRLDTASKPRGLDTHGPDALEKVAQAKQVLAQTAEAATAAF